MSDKDKKTDDVEVVPTGPVVLVAVHAPGGRMPGITVLSMDWSTWRVMLWWGTSEMTAWASVVCKFGMN